ncbi:hypothetical protein EOW77_0032255 [Bradyrhizobium yuanmingense]|uniref:hypothetical protein n=1 Tax=Bradyrhizobium yuanmingense TaxID=108015 RepID=UPI000FE33957|nr:hypothetical protein [Bradyrhizobium yuanmingense]TGN75943.1 hypothetical protein EOW77_0032255 [Bradyrhizobium yuanmingense]
MSKSRNAAQRRLNELSAANDRMSQADKKFFERFPDRRHRVRLAHKAEVEAGAVVNGLNPTQLPSDFKHFVAVKFLSPDCRMRLGFIGLEGSETDVSEALAAAIFEAAKSDQPRAAEIEEKFARALASMGGGQ